MTDRVPLYLPIREDLPAIYQADPDSWEELTWYLQLIDSVLREYVNDLFDLPALLSPNAPTVHPPGLRSDASFKQVYDVQRSALDEVGEWFSTSLPGERQGTKFTDRRAHGESDLEKRSALLRRLPFLYRERSTPTGFLLWFCASFGLRQEHHDECPILVEHFKHRPENHTKNSMFDHDVSLLIPQSEAFQSRHAMDQVADWLEENAPVHLRVRTLFFPPSIGEELRKRLKHNRDLLGTLEWLGREVPFESAARTVALSKSSREGLDLIGSARLAGRSEEAQ